MSLIKLALDNENPDNRVTAVGGIGGAALGLTGYTVAHAKNRVKLNDKIRLHMKERLSVQDDTINHLVKHIMSGTKKSDIKNLENVLKANGDKRIEINKVLKEATDMYEKKYGSGKVRLKTFGKGLGTMVGGALLVGGATRVAQNLLKDKKK